MLGAGHPNGFYVTALEVAIGPALGYWYSRQNGRRSATLGLRLGVLVGSLAGAIGICRDCSPGSNDDVLSTALFVAGGAIVIGSAVWDIARIRGSVERLNAHRSGKTVSISPLARRSGVAVRRVAG